ncbi:CRISPR-associated endonuclease Cas1 [Thioalkalivibrio nitratireducens]|uniref:CRISPR-associated endonuclease Cas1 n=1 Tax=Thioalkalivibrio nitratireducens TaxID=186931 RepID=UPI000319F586|nr:CRISPR-associated endonuclease Cas1 [Thioalkalivibrio nitratireducens]
MDANPPRELRGLPPACEAQPPRPLILDPKTPGLRVELDGPALRVVGEGQSDRYFPLRRVSRIVADASVEFSTEAILACAVRGITIVLHDPSGEAIARVVGHAGQRSELRQRVIDLLAQPEWRPRYQVWLERTEQRIAAMVVKHLGAPRELALDPQRLRQWIGQTGTFFVGDSTEEATRSRFRELATAWMADHLQNLGFGADSEGWQSGEFDLGADLSRLFALRVEPYRLEWLQRRHIWTVATRREARPVRPEMPALIWQQAEPAVSRAGRALTHALHRWLVPLG